MAGEALGILAGAMKGGFKAKKEIAEGRIKESTDQRKQAAIDKRDANHRRLNELFRKSERVAGQEYNTSRDATNLESQKGLLQEGRDYTETQQGSGRYLDGRELTFEELSALSDQDHKRVLTKQEYEDIKKTGERDYLLEDDKLKHTRTMELAKARKTTKATKKDVSEEKAVAAARKRMSEGFASVEEVNSDLASFGYGSFKKSPNEKYYIYVPSGNKYSKNDDLFPDGEGNNIKEVVEGVKSVENKWPDEGLLKSEESKGILSDQTIPDKNTKEYSYPEPKKKEGVQIVGQLANGAMVGKTEQGYKIRVNNEWTWPTPVDEKEIETLIQQGRFGSNTQPKYLNR